MKIYGYYNTPFMKFLISSPLQSLFLIIISNLSASSTRVGKRHFLHPIQVVISYQPDQRRTQAEKTTGDTPWRNISYAFK